MGEPLTDEELQHFIDWPRRFPTDSKFTEERIANMAQELRALRAWKAHLGDPDTWFQAQHKGWADNHEMLKVLQELWDSTRALVERAKEPV